MIKKNRKFKKILFLCLCVALLSTLFMPFVSHAQLNVWDMSILTNANMASCPIRLNNNLYRGASISDYDQESGSFTISVDQPLSSTAISLELKLSEMCPYIKVGDVICFSWDYVGGSPYYEQAQWLNGSQYGDFFSRGEPILVTEQLLESRVILYPFALTSPVGSTLTYTNFRVNLSEVKPFESFSRTFNYAQYLSLIRQEGYNKGELAGMQKETLYYPIFRKENFTSAYAYYGTNSGGLSDRVVLSDAMSENYVSNGYLFNTTVQPALREIPVGYDFIDMISSYWYTRFYYTTADGQTYSSLLEAKDLRITVVVQPGDNIVFIVTVDGTEYSVGFKNETDKPYNREFTNSDFGFADNTKISFITLNYVNQSRARFIDYTITTAEPNVLDGFNVGYQSGYVEGYDFGRNEANPIIYEKGKEEGYALGQVAGYQQGHNVGYTEGYDDGANDDGWYKLLHAVVSAPVDVVSSMLNFNILGINMNAFFTSIITLCCLIALVRFIL